MRVFIGFKKQRACRIEEPTLLSCRQADSPRRPLPFIVLYNTRSSHPLSWPPLRPTSIRTCVDLNSSTPSHISPPQRLPRISPHPPPSITPYPPPILSRPDQHPPSSITASPANNPQLTHVHPVHHNLSPVPNRRFPSRSQTPSFTHAHPRVLVSISISINAPRRTAYACVLRARCSWDYRPSSYTPLAKTPKHVGE